MARPPSHNDRNEALIGLPRRAIWVLPFLLLGPLGPLRCGGDEGSTRSFGATALSSALASGADIDPRDLEGEATWYGRRHHGRTTASGEPFDMYAFTAAHRTLPFDTMVRVVRRDTRQSVVVRINDRGPYGDGRVIDLSRAAAEEIELIRPGHVPVTIEILHLPDLDR